MIWTRKIWGRSGWGGSGVGIVVADVGERGMGVGTAGVDGDEFAIERSGFLIGIRELVRPLPKALYVTGLSVLGTQTNSY